MIHQGDCLTVLRERFADESVQCCVTSPPYWGLRDYGVEGQLGLEKTPEEYVAKMVEVFREVRRVLKQDGTLWLNLGDSYAREGGNSAGVPRHWDGRASDPGGLHDKRPNASKINLKPKDLVGIPWMVAKALQSPYYTGKIAREVDRAWLAAMIDAEGTICGFTHVRKDNGETRNGIHIHVTNSNQMLLDKCFDIWPTTREEHNQHSEGHLGDLPTWRWIVHGIEQKSALLRELYPYFVGKKKQALLAWNFLEISRTTRGRNKGDEGAENREKYTWVVGALSKLNHLEQVDIPSWCKEPPSLYEDGWYLRSDIIWHKPNPMPESVTDRPTKAHEYLFLLTKSAKYYYDAEAIAEPLLRPEEGERATPARFGGADKFVEAQKQSRLHSGNEYRGTPNGKRNKRTVWTVATQPYSEAHFATFPPKLIEPCILAGSRSTGKRCDCDEIIATPLGTGEIIDPSLETGRAGMNRPRRDDEGTRPITRREQRGYAMQLKCSPNRDLMRRIAGSAFEHYERTDLSGGRPLPPHLLKDWLACNWLVEPEACDCPIEPADIVLDPFAGSGTTIEVAQQLGRQGVGIELNPAYIALAEKRTAQAGLPL